MKILLIGCGFLGTHVAACLKKKASVTVTKTSAPCPINDVDFELLKPNTYTKVHSLVKNFDIIIVTASAGRYDYATSYLCLARMLVKALKAHKNKTLIYASSTGVYKESQGGQVYEHSDLDLDKSHILIETEKTYLSLKNTRVVIFRLSGLYGQSERTLHSIYARYQNTPLYPKYVNFIDVEKAAHAIAYACYHPIFGIYNLSSFTIQNTQLFKELFDKEAIIDTNTISLHGYSKQIVSTKLTSEPFFNL